MKKHKKADSKDALSPIFDSSLFFKMMFQNAEHTGILVMDQHGFILDINYGFEKGFGYTRDSLVGQNFSVLFIEDDLKKQLPERELKGVMLTGSHNDDNYLKRADEKPTWVHGESIYIKDEKGQEFVLKVVQDINEEKVLENELKKVNEEQERIILDRETFVYTASHDLLSPINIIDGLVQELKYDKGEDSAVILAMIEKSIRRFRDKIRELSDIGREQEQVRHLSDKVNFQSIYEEVLLDLEIEIKDAGAEFTADFSAAPSVRFSKRNLRSVLQNLLSNALKYRDGKRRSQVSLKTEATEDGYILLAVSDNGIGIAEEAKDLVFRMYQRLHDDSKGTGVGMAIVKRIMDNAGGKIELESKRGDGSTFKIFFPD